MIDLSYTRSQMLNDIEGPAQGTGSFLEDPHDPAFLSGKTACLRLKGQTPEEILPVLNELLCRRFPGEEEEWLFRGLLYPLKKAVGNAYKRGNMKDPARWITLQIVVSPKGAVVEVTDEGNGFDVAAILQKVQTGEKYFAHSGSGFKQFRKTKSVVSFGDGGRTFRIRFFCKQYFPGDPRKKKKKENDHALPK